MKKEEIKYNSEFDAFEIPKAYSVQEILAAGGTTAFAEKLGKKPELIVERLAKLSPDSFLTQEEYDAAIATLNASK